MLSPSLIGLTTRISASVSDLTLSTRTPTPRAARVSATGVCYGSVTSAMVSAELANKGIEIDRKLIIMKDIKKLGEYVATVVFHKEVQVELPVVVVAENADELKAEKERQEQIIKEAAEHTAPKAEEAEEAEEAPAEEAKAE